MCGRLETDDVAAADVCVLLNENEDVPLLYEVAGRFFAAADVKEMLTYYAYFEFYALEYSGFGAVFGLLRGNGADRGADVRFAEKPQGGVPRGRGAVSRPAVFVSAFCCG